MRVHIEIKNTMPKWPKSYCLDVQGEPHHIALQIEKIKHFRVSALEIQ